MGKTGKHKEHKNRSKKSHERTDKEQSERKGHHGTGHHSHQDRHKVGKTQQHGIGKFVKSVCLSEAFSNSLAAPLFSAIFELGQTYSKMKQSNE